MTPQTYVLSTDWMNKDEQAVFERFLREAKHVMVQYDGTDGKKYAFPANFLRNIQKVNAAAPVGDTEPHWLFRHLYGEDGKPV